MDWRSDAAKNGDQRVARRLLRTSICDLAARKKSIPRMPILDKPEGKVCATTGKDLSRRPQHENQSARTLGAMMVPLAAVI